MGKTANKETARIRSLSVDKNGDVILAYDKYGWFMCLFHSLYGLLLLLLLVGCTIMLVCGWSLIAILAFVGAVFCWAGAWLNANDKLKKKLYPSILLEQLANKKVEVIDNILIIRYLVSGEYIEMLTKDGDLRRYAVEFLREDSPLYVVKIHTAAKTGKGAI